MSWRMIIPQYLHGFGVLILSVVVLCGTASAGSFYKIETKHVTFLFNTENDAMVFRREINYPSSNSLAGLFGGTDKGDNQRKLIRNVDLLFEKVQSILDMKKKMGKVRVRVFSNKGQLCEAYEKIFHGKCNVRGWYLYEFNTVYLNVKDVHEGMLAHELGHAIIDHYLDVRPPRATAEILAKYVDQHLFDEVRTY